MHPEKTIGRFGVATNQTLKKNDHIRIQERAIGHYKIHGEQVAFSTSRHKAWEILDHKESPSLNTQLYAQEELLHSQEKRQTKKKQFQQHLNKNKHSIRLQHKEQSKLKRSMEQEKSKPLPTTNTETSIEEPSIVKTFIGKENRFARGVNVPENGILVSEVMSRGQIYKLMQHRDRLNSPSDKSRNQKKEEFVKSIFL